MKKVLSTVLNVICIAIIILAVFILFSVVTTPKGQPPRVLGFSGFRVLTGSMEPAIPTDSFVLVKLCDASEIRENDIISFYSTDESIRGQVNTHRVIEVHNDGSRISFTTKGDNNMIDDKIPVYEEQLIGKVVVVSAFLGKFVRLISNPLIFGAVIVIPLLLIMFSNIRGMAKDVKQLVAEEEAEEKAKREAAKAAETAKAAEVAKAAEAAEETAEAVSETAEAAKEKELAEEAVAEKPAEEGTPSEEPAEELTDPNANAADEGE